MTTDDERRDIAAKLQDIDTGHCYTSRDVLRAIEDACGCNVGQGWQDMVELKDRLADLIEPEPERTCRDLGGEYGTNYEAYDFGCSECGFGCDIPQSNYCPHCGAKVVE